MKKSLDKSLLLIIMLLNISDSIFLNISPKNKLNMLLRKEKSRNMNIFQLKDKLFTILNKNCKSEEFQEAMFKEVPPMESLIWVDHVLEDQVLLLEEQTMQSVNLSLTPLLLSLLSTLPAQALLLDTYPEVKF